jgi:transposase
MLIPSQHIKPFVKGNKNDRNDAFAICEAAENGLTPMARHYLQHSLREWQALDQSIAELDDDIGTQVKQDDQASRLLEIRGVGPMIASAASALAGGGECYRNGRHFAANLGLVPREHSSGGKQKLGRITRRGNQYLRKLLVEGAWSVIRYAHRSDDRLSRWARQLIKRRGKQVAAVAVANKLARIIWAMSYHQSEYRP